MNNLIWTIALTISIAGMFLILNPTPNVAMAYSCSSSSSTVGSNSESSGVSGTSGSCATSASSSSKTETKGGGGGVPSEGANISHVPGVFCLDPPACSVLPFHGQPASGSLSIGGLQSSCSSISASRANVGNFFIGSVPGSVSCSSHNP